MQSRGDSAIRLQEFDESVAQLRVIGLATTAGALLAMAAFFLMMRRYLTRPLKRLDAFVADIREPTAMSRRSAVERDDEIGGIAAALNRMLDGLRETAISRDHFNHVISNLTNALVVVDAAGGDRHGERGRLCRARPARSRSGRSHGRRRAACVGADRRRRRARRDRNRAGFQRRHAHADADLGGAAAGARGRLGDGRSRHHRAQEGRGRDPPRARSADRAERHEDALRVDDLARIPHSAVGDPVVRGTDPRLPRQAVGAGAR